MSLINLASLATFFLFLILSPSAVSPSPTDAESRSAYDILQEFNFPIGLLPEGALGFNLDRTTGRFKANLNGSCNFSPDAFFSLKYNSTISGQISRDRLMNLEGVSVKILFFWVDIVEVVRDGEDLKFYVGIGSASFPADNFSECPRCEVACNGGKVRKLKTKSFVSSI